MRRIAQNLAVARRPEPDQPDPRVARFRQVAQAFDGLAVLVLHLADELDADGDPLLTPAEAAEELRCSESHIRAACASKQIAAMKNGGWLMRRSALRDYERRITEGGAA